MRPSHPRNGDVESSPRTIEWTALHQLQLFRSLRSRGGEFQTVRRSNDAYRQCFEKHQSSIIPASCPRCITCCLPFGRSIRSGNGSSRSKRRSSFTLSLGKLSDRRFRSELEKRIVHSAGSNSIQSIRNGYSQSLFGSLQFVYRSEWCKSPQASLSGIPSRLSETTRTVLTFCDICFQETL